MALFGPDVSAQPITAFPARRLARGSRLFRIARADRHPWWFGSSMAGRFDLASPHGTCYLAVDPVGALLEVVGHGRRGGLVTAEMLDDRHLFTLLLDSDWHLAQTTARRAFRFGITGEIGTVVPYTVPQAWAAAWHAEGFVGVLYALRHDPARSTAVARFGDEGLHTHWPVTERTRVTRSLHRELEAITGVIVAEIPRADQLRFTDATP